MKLDVKPPQNLGQNGDSDWTSIADFMTLCAFILNGNIDPIDNLKLEFHRVEFTNTEADVDVRHKLGRLARGYFVVRRTGNWGVYDGLNTWNTNSIFIRGAGHGYATILIF